MGEIKNKKLLIVDDELEIRNMVEGFLRKEGFGRIYQASNCTEALEVCQSIKPDIAILDVMLPDGDGFSLYPPYVKYQICPSYFYLQEVRMKIAY